MNKEEFKEFLGDIDKSNINQKMLEIPSLVFEHSYNYSNIIYNLKELEAELEEKVLKLSISVRRQLQSTGQKNYTESKIKELVMSDENVLELKEAIRDKELKVKRSKAYLEALKTARELLPNVSNNYREERRSTEKLSSKRRA